MDQGTEDLGVPARRVDRQGREQVSYGAVMGLTVPLVLSFSVKAIMGLTDTWFVGRISSQALAGMNAAYLPSLTAVVFFFALGQAVQIRVAQGYGAGQRQRAARSTWAGLWLAIAILPICGLLVGVGGWIYGWARLPEAVAAEALRYWQPFVWGGSSGLGFFALTSFFNGIGKTWITMVIALGGILLNTALNGLLIFGLNWGIAGVAWGTILSEYAQVGVMVGIFLSGAYRREFGSHRQWRITGKDLRDLLRLGVPMGIFKLADLGSLAIFQLMIAQLGTVEGAATHICLMWARIAYLPGNGLSQTATVLVGQAIGAGRMDWARRVGQAVLRLTLGYMVGVMAIMLLFTEPLVDLFVMDGDPEAAAVVAEGSVLIQWLALSLIFEGFSFVGSGCLRGAGDVQIQTWLMIGTSWMVFLPLAHLLIFAPGQGWLPLPGLGWGARGGWAAEVIYIAVLGMSLLWRWQGGGWQRITIPA